MEVRSIRLVAVGWVILILAILLVFQLADRNVKVGRHSEMPESRDGVVVSDVSTGDLDGECRRVGSAQKSKARKVVYNPGAFKALDWSIDELDGFLKETSAQLSSREMVSLLSGILPDPAGAKALANRLKPGSVPLKEQMRLCMKYLKPADQPILFSSFWFKYGKGDSLDEYRRDVLEQMPLGDVRTQAMAEYYFAVYENYSSVEELLASDELAKMRAKESASKVGQSSDYVGAVRGVEGILMSILERGEASKEDIVGILQSSVLDEQNKAKMIQAIEKRGAEVEILRKPNPH